MFYYCAKCGNIKKVTLKGNDKTSFLQFSHLIHMILRLAERRKK